MERRRSIRQKGWGGRVGWLWWWLIGQKGSVWVSSFVFFVFSCPCSPFPFVDHGRASPYHAMLCMRNAREQREG